MSDSPRLTLAFLEHAPRAAAEVMQGLPTEEVASFFDAIPARHSAPALDKMIPWQAARCLELVEPSQSALILRQLPFNDAVSFARLMRTESLDLIVAELPSAYGRRLRSALSYPLHQVGAWIDPEVLRLRTSDTARDAVRMLRAGTPASHVFLEADADGRFAGAVTVRDVLRAEPTVRLDQLPLDGLLPVSNLAPMASVGFDERWDESLSLPVVGRRGNLLGGLSRHALRMGMHQHRAATRSESRTLAEHLIAALIIVCGEILNLTVPSQSAGRTRAAGVSSHDS